MSHIRWIPPRPDRMPVRSAWRLFPWLIGAGMGVVVAVNAGMIYAAVASFPGKTADRGFALNNQYNALLDHAQREAELGWTLRARTDAAGRPVVALTDRDAMPLRGASVAGLARRPLGDPATHRLIFHESEAGHYVADTALTMLGQWDLTLTASVRGHHAAATRRVFVR